MHPSELIRHSIQELAVKSTVKIVVMKDNQASREHLARSIADELAANNKAGKPSRLILPVGPTDQYPILARICNEEGIGWRNVHTFNMDEYLDWQGRPVSYEHPLCFRRAMDELLFNQLRPEYAVPPDQTHFPSPYRIDQIGEDIRRVGGIDTCYGGVGYHGHIAFNEAPISRYYEISNDEFRNSLTRVLHLAEETMVTNSQWDTGGNPYVLPPMAVTLGMKDILGSKRVRIYGGSPFLIRMALAGDVSPRWPITFLQEHEDATLIVSPGPAEYTYAGGYGRPSGTGRQGEASR